MRFPPGSPARSSALTLVVGILISLAAALLLPTFHGFRVTGAKIDELGKPPTEITFPYFEEHAAVGSSRIEVTFELDSSRAPTMEVLIKADDCLQTLAVNGALVPGLSLPWCDFNGTKRVRLEGLRSGRNQLTALVLNNGGPSALSIHPSIEDPGSLFRLAALLIVLFGGWRVTGRRVSPETRPALAVLCGGITLRVVYSLFSIFPARSLDGAAHLEYLRFILEHHALPPIYGGWEFFQPPLYYLVAAAFLAIERGLGVSEFNLVWPLQTLALLISIWFLPIGFAVARRLFSESPLSQTLMVAILAFSPPLVFHAGAITNDSLLLLIAGAATLTVLQSGESTRASGARFGLLGAAGILSKSNAVAFIAPLFLALGVDRTKPLKSRLQIGIIAGLIMIMFAAPYLYLRVLSEGQSSVIGNIGTLHAALGVRAGLDPFLHFNPIRILDTPALKMYEAPLELQYFWECVYRSFFLSQFGEEVPTWLARALLAAGLMIPIFVLRTALRREFPASLALLLVFEFAALLAIRIQHPFTATQDFRLIAPALIPIAAAVGYCARPPGGWRAVAFCTTILFSTLAAASVLSTIL